MKFQIPNSKLQRSSKHQCRSGVRSCFGAWSLGFLWCLVFGAWCFPSPTSASAQTSVAILSSNVEPPTVGMEGRLEVILPEAGLSTEATDHRAPLLLRIAATQPHGTLTRYDLRYIGRVPGQHDLREYLFTTNGTPATNLPPLPVAVVGLLPNPYNGWLEEQARKAPSLFSGYRATIAVVIVLWVVAFFVILRVGRRPKLATIEPPVRGEPTFADRLRPLVERAAAGTLSADEKAALERMLIYHWQQRLHLSAANGEELIMKLREHPEAGVLLRTLEDWLHRPPGSVKVSVEAVLKPYCNLQVDLESEVKA